MALCAIAANLLRSQQFTKRVPERNRFATLDLHPFPLEVAGFGPVARCMYFMRTALATLLLLTACTTTTPPPDTRPPWSAPALIRTDVPAPYATQWEKAENRSTCALIAPRTAGAKGVDATPRAATFSGGWAVAYDLPNLRSAFGVAGTGASVGDASYDQWPHSKVWDDGSQADYGPEGGTGPNELAYLRIEGQDCLYNVWSRLGRDHLELLMDELRFVR
jgi:hypothetical protein